MASGDKLNDANAGAYKVGVMLPMTGDAAAYGETARDVYLLAVEEINKEGGVNGKNIELVIEDSKCNGKDASNAAQKLINVDKVQVIIGGFCSGESIAAVPLAQAAKVALFSAGSSSPDLTNSSKFFFRNYPSDASQGKVLAEVAFKDKGWKKVGMLQEQTDYATALGKTFASTIQGLGGQIVKEEFPTSMTDFRAALTKLRSDNINALFVDAQTEASAARVFKQIEDLKWKPNLIVSDPVLGSANTVAQYKTLLEGTIGAEFGVDVNNPKYKHLSDAYKAKYGKDMNHLAYAQTEYDAVYMVRDALKDVGYDGEKIADWSRKVKDWDGASGKITIQADGDRASGHTPKVVKNGKVEVYTK